MASLTFTPIPDQYELYHTSAAEDGFNFFGFSDSEVDRLLERGRESFDQAEREAIYRRLQRRLVELQLLFWRNPGSPLSTAQLADRLDVAPRTVRKYLTELSANGRLPIYRHGRSTLRARPCSLHCCRRRPALLT